MDVHVLMEWYEWCMFSLFGEFVSFGDIVFFLCISLHMNGLVFQWLECIHDQQDAH